MAFFLYASFPNSRIKPRPSTTVAFTPNVVCPPGVATLVLVGSLDRTYANIRNLDSAQLAYYGYDAGIDGTVANGGELLEPLETVNDIQSPQDLYVFNPGAGAINVGIDFGEG